MADSAAQMPAGSTDNLESNVLSKTGTPRARAVKDDKQLAAFIKTLEQKNRDRNIKNGRIMAKYNAEKPTTNAAQEAEGLGWKSNFSTQPLATLIDRVAPRFARALDSVRYLTSAALPDHVPGAAQKTERFRKSITELIRARDGWKNFVAEVAQENALFGYDFAGYTDEYSWMPTFYRQDEFFVPDATHQNIARCPALVLRETYLPHELYELIEDEKAASDAGWDIEETVKTINNAMPDDFRKGASNDIRKYEDLRRESNLCASFGAGAKVCIVYSVLVTEVTGKVSHYMMDGTSYKQIFKREDRFDSMLRVGRFFSFQQANGKLMASKGVGRTVYALAGIVDRSRNEVVDRLQLSGKIIIQGDDKHIRTFKMSVVGNAVVISKSFTVTQSKIDAGVEPFLQLDAWTARLMDELAGNVSPAGAANQLQGERVTNGQVNFIADLQNEVKDAKIERFLTQAASLISEMQRRASDPKCDDEDAKEHQARCLEIMSEDELASIAKKPAAQTVEDYTDLERQTIISVCTELVGNPLVDQKKNIRRKLTAAVDDEFADDILLPDEDATVTAEQIRTAMFENEFLKGGKQVPVSPRDAHVVHLKEHVGAAEEVSALVAQDPHAAEVMKIISDHLKAHIQSAEAAGAPDEDLAPYIEAVTKIDAGIQKVAQLAQAHLDSTVPPPTPLIQ